MFCIFCGQKSQKAKEHIWPKWLQVEVTGDTKRIYRGSHINMLTLTDQSTRFQTGEKLVFGSICNDCNNGWMSSLENDSKNIIIEILKDASAITSLNKVKRQILSLWSFKTALMINAGSNYRRIVPDFHYQHIFKYQALPKDLKVDLGTINDTKELAWRQSQVSFGLVPENKQEEFVELMRLSYIITMQIKHIGIRIIYLPSAKEKGYSVQFGNFAKCLRIWPYQKNGLFNFRNGYESIDEFDLDNVVLASTQQRV